MTVKLLAPLPPFPVQAVVSLPAATETALVDAGLATTSLSGGFEWEAAPASLAQIPLLLRPITAAQRAAPTAGMLSNQRVVYDDGTQWFQSNGTDLIPVAQPRNGWPRHLPTRDGVQSAAVQFRGATDSAASLGTLGIVLNADTDAAAGALLQAGTPDLLSTINGASTLGAWVQLESAAPITSVHIGQVSMAGAYVLQQTGACSAASLHFTRLDFNLADNITRLEWLESSRTNYAGTPGTGSARSVMLIGVEEA